MADTILALQVPVPAGSRGRNGTFTATALTLQARAGTTEAPGYVALHAESSRPGLQPPATISLSLEDAVLLAEEIRQAVDRLLGAPATSCPDCGHRLDATTSHNGDADGRPTYCPACDREIAEERENAPAAPTAPR